MKVVKDTPENIELEEGNKRKSDTSSSSSESISSVKSSDKKIEVPEKEKAINFWRAIRIPVMYSSHVLSVLISWICII